MNWEIGECSVAQSWFAGPVSLTQRVEDGEPLNPPLCAVQSGTVKGFASAHNKTNHENPKGTESPKEREDDAQRLFGIRRFHCIWRLVACVSTERYQILHLVPPRAGCNAGYIWDQIGRSTLRCFGLDRNAFREEMTGGRKGGENVSGTISI